MNRANPHTVALFCCLVLRNGLIPRNDVETDAKAGRDWAKIQIQFRVCCGSGEWEGDGTPQVHRGAGCPKQDTRCTCYNEVEFHLRISREAHVKCQPDFPIKCP